MTVLDTVRDSTTMLRRTLRHARRMPAYTLSSLLVPIVFLLLFVLVLGGTLGAGLAGSGSYVDYLAPGILVMAVANGAQQTVLGVCSDMAGGVIARFRTMPVARTSVLTGHAVANMLRTVLITAIVLGAAVAVGFRPSAGPVEWLALLGLVALLALAIGWLSVAMGLAGGSPEGASSLSLLVSTILPFLSSAFVPPDSLPAGLRWFAEYQPFTPFVETVRGLLLGTPSGANGPIALAWCVVIAVGGYGWARALFRREKVR